MLGILPDWERLIHMWDRLSQCLIIFLLLLYVIICGDVPSTIYGSFDEDRNKLNNFLGISYQSETWFKTILQHHSGYHLVHNRHGSLWGQVFTSGIYELHHEEICTSRYFINDWGLSSRVTPFSMNNHLSVLPNELHHLMQSRRDSSSHMDERPPQKKFIAGIDIRYLKLCIEFCWTHLDDQIHCSQCISLNPIKGSYVDLVLFQLLEVKP